MKENGTLEKMGWTLSDDWEDHLLARLWLFAVVVLIGYSTYLNKELDSTKRIGKFSDSLLRRLEIHSSCCSICRFLCIAIIYTFAYIPLTSVGFYASVAGLSVSLATMVYTRRQFYPYERELSILTLATAMKFQCFETAITINQAKLEWEKMTAIETPIRTEEMIEKSKRCCCRTWFPMCAPAARDKPLENGRLGQAMIRDELTKVGILKGMWGSDSERLLK